MANYKLTGKFYHRKTIIGMVLYVEIVDRSAIESTPDGHVTYTKVKYKKASEQDASDLIRWFQLLVYETKKMI
ncbi:hypothetical protein ACR787_24930 [Sphingobacterium multivorum]|uniref:hypothetical protein n=1 Tax=Sphingobacterium multivorum TaxID=28454 RepID=UPI003DA64BC0